MNKQLLGAFGEIDIYLFDQLLKGRFDDCKEVIDIGCGGGRNIVWFLKNGFDVYGIDRDAAAIDAVTALANDLAPCYPSGRFAVAKAEDLPFDDASFDVAICSAILHFANDPAHFDKMLRSVWRVLRPGGYLFARLASDIGMERLVESAGNGRYRLPDGTVRFLVNEQTLLQYTSDLNGALYEPIKTTVVSKLRCMTTWCIRKK